MKEKKLETQLDSMNKKLIELEQKLNAQENLDNCTDKEKIKSLIFELEDLRNKWVQMIDELKDKNTECKILVNQLRILLKEFSE